VRIIVYSMIAASMFSRWAVRKLIYMCPLSPGSQQVLESLSLSPMYSVCSEWSDVECSPSVFESSSLSELNFMFSSAALACTYAFFLSLKVCLFFISVLTGYLLHLVYVWSTSCDVCTNNIFSFLHLGRFSWYLALHLLVACISRCYRAFTSCIPCSSCSGLLVVLCCLFH
jgi:hypothetical protein